MTEKNGRRAVELPGELLLSVEKPARYVGNEYNSRNKHRAAGRNTVSWVLAFPDVYEIGMSNLGQQILYSILNDAETAWADRVYTPWPDMQRAMKDRQIPLFALESRFPVAEFDVIGVSLPYELCYTNVLSLLGLAGLPLAAALRDLTMPLVVGGGTGVANCEPMAEFFDCFFFGEGEDGILAINEAVYRFWKSGSGDKAELLLSLAQIPGVYVPSLYRPCYDDEGKGRLTGVRPIHQLAPIRVRRQWVDDWADRPGLEKPLLPNVATVHDRITLEIFRGCTRGCRFCQAGMLYRPVREKPRDRLVEQAVTMYRNSGFDEISLLSLSSTDYSEIGPLLDQLLTVFCPLRVNVVLPSLRIDGLSEEIAGRLQSVRRGGLTLAPEAGSQRLRDAINKGITERDILDAAAAAFRAGCKSVKLYFMIGLPGETDEDIDAIGELARKICQLYDVRTDKRDVRVKISLSNFVPKPHTPFERSAFADRARLRSRQRQLVEAVRRERRILVSWHDVETSFWEAVLSRGDRRLSRLIRRAWEKGAGFDGWAEWFRPGIWQEAGQECGIDPESIVYRQWPEEECLPWQVMDSGVSSRFFRRERELAARAETTPDCRTGICSACGLACKQGDENMVTIV